MLGQAETVRHGETSSPHVSSDMPSDRQGGRECRNGRSIFRPWHATVVEVVLCCLFSDTELSVDDVNRQLPGIREAKGNCSADPPRQGWRGGAPKDGFTACRRSGPFVQPLQSNQIDQLFTLFGISRSPGAKNIQNKQSDQTAPGSRSPLLYLASSPPNGHLHQPPCLPSRILVSCRPGSGPVVARHTVSRNSLIKI